MDPRFLRTFVRVVRLGSFSAAARELGYTRVWSTEPRPYLPGEVRTNALPRHPVFGTWPAAKSALLILMQAVKWRFRSRGREAGAPGSELQV